MTRRVFGGLRRRHGGWRIYYRGPDGRQVEEGVWSDRREAASVLTQRRRELADGTWVHPRGARKPDALTVRGWAVQWLDARKHVVKASDERRYLEVHVLPTIGDMPIADLRSSHIVALMRRVRETRSTRTGRVLAPRTVLHIYRTLHACLDAAVRDRAPGMLANPADLSEKRGELPKKKDADPTWRERSIFTREDVARILHDERIPDDRRVYYALGLLAGMRSSEIAGLHWRDVDLTRRPLGCVRVATQASRDLSTAERATKTEEIRDVPIHPLLGRILAEWRLGGFALLFCRIPEPDDLVVPSRQDGRSPRSKKSLERMKEDLASIGVTVPPATRHAMRATLITLLDEDGARESITRRWTHGDGPKDAHAGYKRPSWEAQCAEMVKLRIDAPKARKVGE